MSVLLRVSSPVWPNLPKYPWAGLSCLTWTGSRRAALTRGQTPNPWAGGWTKPFHIIFVWVCAGEPGGGGPSAEAEGGAVRSDPRPQPAGRSRLRFATWPQEAASPPGGSGQRESAGSQHAHRQNTAAATGALKRRSQMCSPAAVDLTSSRFSPPS